MMELKSLKRVAIEARNVFADNHNDFHMSFSRFPHACCGNVSDFLGCYLQKKGVIGLVCVFGVRDDRQSHGWVEINGIIIDLTVDQFDDMSTSIVITSDRKYYSKFKNQIKAAPAIAKSLEKDFEYFSQLLDGNLAIDKISRFTQ